MTTDKGNGFTLIELSIVLVIIGLIIGGILVGQDMIRGATVRAQISQLQKYNTAVNTFRGKYGYLPGDMPPGPAKSFGFYVDSYCGGSYGNSPRNGSGLIDDDGLLDGDAEGIVAWLDLSMAGLIDQSFTLSPWTAAGQSPCQGYFYGLALNQAFPTAKLTGNSITFAADYASSNWFFLTTGALFGAGGLFSISVSDAYQIDTKIDDGRPTTGNVVARIFDGSGWSSYDPYYSAPTDSTMTAIGLPPCFNTTNYAYSTTYQGGTSLACWLSVKLQ